MNDMGAVIIPKSDQLNSDDLIAGPMTIKITDVSIRAGQEQPISISFEGDNGKPYKACKSMCRVMVTAWGRDSNNYIGRSMTLYRDPSVKWGGMEVGGIRISHMSDIDSKLTMALTATRGNKKPYTVLPLVAAHGAPASGGPITINAGQQADLVALCDEVKVPISKILKQCGVDSVEYVTIDDYNAAVEFLKKKQAA